MNNKFTLLRILKITIFLFTIIFLTNCTSTHIFSGRINAEMLEPGNVEVPSFGEERKSPRIDEYGKDDLSGRVVTGLIDYWANKDLPEWDISGAKVHAPRILLAKLIKGVDIKLVNNYLLNVAAEPWSESGSTWSLRNEGDYDFTEVPLTAILYKFGNHPDLLYPETKKHILHTLLIESGHKVRPYVPGSLNLVPDTENHILMTEGSRFLKNQYLREIEGVSDPDFNNQTNGVETFLSDYLDELIMAGLFEFNSLPYSGYTITALLNLEAYAEGPVALKARELLDTIMFKYALGSLDMRRCVPFRRQTVKAGTTSLQADDASIISRIWVIIDDPEFPILPITDRKHNAFYAAVMPYRLPDKTLYLIKEKKNPYYVQMGRGVKASPEIFSGGSGYLLSAGGVSRGNNSMIVARPTTLMLSDGQTEYTDCFHLPGRGTYKDWNNTGVFLNFACSNNPVVIPSWAKPVASAGGWLIFKTDNSVTIAVCNDEVNQDYGLLVVFPDYKEPSDYLAKTLSDINHDHSRLVNQFIWPNGDLITYNLNAPKNKWVISSFNNEVLNRDFDNWPGINCIY